MEFQAEGPPAQAQQNENQIASRTEQDLQRFKKMIETQGKESGAWRGEVRDAQVTKPNDAQGRGGRMQQNREQQGQALQRQGGGQADVWFPRVTEVWEEPFVVMRKMSEEMDHFFERFIGRPLGMPQWAQNGREWAPQVEVAQRDDQIVISADLPGIKTEDIQVQVQQNKLTIEGERHSQMEQQEQAYQRTERVYGHFYREIPLPEGVDPDAAAASMHDGVLEVRVPVLPEQRRVRRIDIQTPR